MQNPSVVLAVSARLAFVSSLAYAQPKFPQAPHHSEDEGYIMPGEKKAAVNVAPKKVIKLVVVICVRSHFLPLGS